jgi:hypothetical protein
MTTNGLIAANFIIVMLFVAVAAHLILNEIERLRKALQVVIDYVIEEENDN